MRIMLHPPNQVQQVAEKASNLNLKVKSQNLKVQILAGFGRSFPF